MPLINYVGGGSSGQSKNVYIGTLEKFNAEPESVKLETEIFYQLDEGEEVDQLAYKSDLKGLLEDVRTNSDDISALRTSVDTNAENISTLSEEVEVTKKSVSDGKTLVANAITEMGVETATNAAFATMADNIMSISSGGQYVWKKYKRTIATHTVTNPSFTISKDTSISSSYMKITSSDFDVMKVKADFLDGFKYSSYSFYLNNGYLIHTYNSSNYTAGYGQGILYMSSYYTPSNGSVFRYTGTKTYEEVVSSEFIGYISDSDLNKYPNKGYLDGYYYELVPNSLISRVETFYVYKGDSVVFDISDWNVDNIIGQQYYDFGFMIDGFGGRSETTDILPVLDRTNKTLTVNPTACGGFNLIEWNCKKCQAVYATISDDYSKSVTVEATPEASARYTALTKFSNSSTTSLSRGSMMPTTILLNFGIVGSTSNSSGSSQRIVIGDPNDTTVTFDSGTMNSTKKWYGVVIDI